MGGCEAEVGRPGCSAAQAGKYSSLVNPQAGVSFSPGGGNLRPCPGGGHDLGPGGWRGSVNVRGARHQAGNPTQAFSSEPPGRPGVARGVGGGFFAGDARENRGMRPEEAFLCRGVRKGPARPYPTRCRGRGGGEGERSSARIDVGVSGPPALRLVVRKRALDGARADSSSLRGPWRHEETPGSSSCLVGGSPDGIVAILSVVGERLRASSWRESRRASSLDTTR